jgi:hypothetical protein
VEDGGADMKVDHDMTVSMEQTPTSMWVKLSLYRPTGSPSTLSASKHARMARVKSSGVIARTGEATGSGGSAGTGGSAKTGGAAITHCPRSSGAR